MSKHTLKLIRYKVSSFKSVGTTSWINVDDTTALIGTNESGKTNLLLPLWKLNPAKEGEIDLQTDCPRSKYVDIRALDEENMPDFIEAEFEVSSELKSKLAELTGDSEDFFSTVIFSKSFGNTFSTSFPNWLESQTVKRDRIIGVLDNTKERIQSLGELQKKGDLNLRPKVLDSLSTCIKTVSMGASDDVEASVVEAVAEDILKLDLSKAPKTSVLTPIIFQLQESLSEIQREVTPPESDIRDKAEDLVESYKPSFVYYSNYGNLDSEIYLPHVIENLKRDDLGPKEAAKARTLRVLFDFVGLSPEEILELGQEEKNSTDEQIEKSARNTKERDILLQSASTKLTKEFKEWWLQGEYNFRFQADGNHFRIWVSDERRPDEVELEGRSTGLQWFLSFFLTFLVEREEAHHGCVLLLDEPGLSLHPVAQKDLSRFFDKLSESNQIIYTTHSPFLVDADKLERVKAVYVDKQGLTAVSDNLREGVPNELLRQSVYAVHAAIGLSVSDVVLAGSCPIIVEGPSDQHYLSFIKTYLVSKGIIKPKYEMIFLPSGGVRGVKALSAIVSGVSDNLPNVFLDGDSAGVKLKESLEKNLYEGNEARIKLTTDFLSIDCAESEDLFPMSLMQMEAAKIFRGPENDFVDEDLDVSKSFVGQAEAYLEKHNLKLEGWKVDLAVRVKRRLTKNDKPLDKEEDLIAKWKQIFEFMMT